MELNEFVEALNNSVAYEDYLWGEGEGMSWPSVPLLYNLILSLFLSKLCSRPSLILTHDRKLEIKFNSD